MLFYQDTIFSTTIQAEGQGNAKNFIAKARKFTDMTELTPELLRTFVAKIIVYEKEVKYSKHAPQKIHICFRDFNLNETDDMLLCGETTEKADSTILPTLRRARSRSLRPRAMLTKAQQPSPTITAMARANTVRGNTTVLAALPQDPR